MIVALLFAILLAIMVPNLLLFVVGAAMVVGLFFGVLAITGAI